MQFVDVFEHTRARASWFRRCMNMAVSSLVRGGQIGLCERDSTPSNPTIKSADSLPSYFLGLRFPNTVLRFVRTRGGGLITTGLLFFFCVRLDLDRDLRRLSFGAAVFTRSIIDFDPPAPGRHGKQLTWMQWCFCNHQNRVMPTYASYLPWSSAYSSTNCSVANSS